MRRRGRIDRWVLRYHLKLKSIYLLLFREFNSDLLVTVSCKYHTSNLNKLYLDHNENPELFVFNLDTFNYIS